MRPEPRRFLVLGGGCYGSHYASALLRAFEKGKTAGSEIWVVDRDPACRASKLAAAESVRIVERDWLAFLREDLGPNWDLEKRECRDLIVPSPFTPHLFAQWLRATLEPELAVEPVPPDTLPDVPFARRGPEAGFALSFAEWTCPVHCIEPYTCPATRQRRDWDLRRALIPYARTLRAAGTRPLLGPFVARCTHLVEGVGCFPAVDWLRARDRVREELRGGTGFALVATTSSCHGVGTLLRITDRGSIAPATAPGRG